MGRFGERMLLAMLALVGANLPGTALAQNGNLLSEMRAVVDGAPASRRAPELVRMVLLRSSEPVDDPDEISVLTWAMNTMIQTGSGDELSRWSLEAVRNGRQESIGQPFAMSLATNALDSAATEESDLVPVLLNQIRSVDALTRMLAQRRYSTIWPQVEARVGPHMSSLLAQMMQEERALFVAADPGSTAALFRMAFVLYSDRQYQAVVDLVNDWRSRHPGREIDENLAWSINQQAFALLKLGRIDEVDRAMAEVAELPVGNRSWVINFAINRAELLLANERFEAALAAARRAQEMRGSAFAGVSIARVRACSLANLARHDEAMRELPLLRENLAVSIEAAGSGMLCLGQRASLVTALRTLLSDEAIAAANFGLLQDAEIGSPFGFIVAPDVRTVFADEPDLRSLLEQGARRIPAEFMQQG